jgi:hypothetical protein
MCGCKGQHDINGIQWLKSIPQLKGIVVDRAMKGSVVVVLNIGETLIPCARMFGVVHAQDMHDQSVDDFYLTINIVESMSVTLLDNNFIPATSHPNYNNLRWWR